MHRRLLFRAHAEDTPSLRQIRVVFSKPSGGQGSLTMSPSHMMYKLTTAAVGDEATNMEQCRCSKSLERF